MKLYKGLKVRLYSIEELKPVDNGKPPVPVTIDDVLTALRKGGLEVESMISYDQNDPCMVLLQWGEES